MNLMATLHFALSVTEFPHVGEDDLKPNKVEELFY